MADCSHFARERLTAFTPWHLDAVSGSHPPHLLWVDSVEKVFMRHDATAQLYFAPSQFEAYLDYAFAGVADGKVAARAFSVPFAFNVDGRDELPDGGWDQVIRWAHEDRMVGRASTALSALEITLVPEARGSGNSIALLNAMKCCARANRYKALFAPVRPNMTPLPYRSPGFEEVSGGGVHERRPGSSEGQLCPAGPAPGPFVAQRNGGKNG